MKRNLRTRLMANFLIAILVTAIIVVALADLITLNQIAYMVTFTGLRTARLLAPTFAEYYAQHGSWDGVDQLMRRYRLALDVHHPSRPMMPQVRPETHGRVLLLDAQGHQVADSVPNQPPLSLSAEDKAKGFPIVVQDRLVGSLIVVSTLPGVQMERALMLRQIRRWMILAGGIATLAGLIVSAMQARRIAAPVRALAQAARQIAAGDFSRRVPVTGEDELAEMAQAFNSMVAQLAQQQALRRQAMSDVAHELRTPLSVLQIELESLEDGLTQPTPETIAALKAEVDHLGRLVEDLRVLSLSEAGELPLTRERLDLAELSGGVLQRLQGAAAEKAVALVSQLPSTPVVVWGDAQRLTQVLLNLLTNALRHTPPGGTITVCVRVVGDEAQVSVQDTGEGIAPEVLPHIFERHYRPQGSDSGLGLSIAQHLIRAHGGRIWAQSRLGEGSTFTFSLPLA